MDLLKINKQGLLRQAWLSYVFICFIKKSSRNNVIQYWARQIPPHLRNNLTLISKLLWCVIKLCIGELWQDVGITCWFWYAVTVVKTVSGKENALTPSPVGTALTGESSSPHSLRMTWTRGWYLCMECRMIWKTLHRASVFRVGNGGITKAVFYLNKNTHASIFKGQTAL